MFIGGASGTGKSSIAYELAKYYSVNVMEADDVCEAIKAMRYPHSLRTQKITEKTGQ